MDKLRLNLIFILILFPVFLFGKTEYLIILKGGTKIKADSYIKQGNYIKVYKFGGYIIYPAKNIKDIKEIKSLDNVNKKVDNLSKSPKNQKNTCNPIVKDFNSQHVYNKEKQNFDLKISGLIENKCDFYVTHLKITVHFYNEDNKELFTKYIDLDDIAPFDSLNFSKIFDESHIGEIKYFNYKLEFVKE